MSVSRLTTVFRMGELFCGAGGLALGAMRARVKKGRKLYRVAHEWATDYDHIACETFAENIMPRHPERVVCDDVRNLDLASLSPIDALAFGFPCNDFSIVGEQRGLQGEFGPLYQYGVRAVEIHEPVWFLAENVGGLHNADEGKTFKRILRDLENAGRGYTVTPHLYKFEEYGVPQTRHRIIIVGIRKDLGVRFWVPAPTHLGRLVSAEDALCRPPIPDSAGNQEKTRQAEKVVNRLKHIRPGENAWSALLPEDLKLNVRGARLSHIYKRLDPGVPAYTITASGGGGTHVYHWSEPRALTNRERARLQTFPDDFKFAGPKEAVRRQIGMAVPPLAARVIVTAILQTLAGVPYPVVQSAYWAERASDDTLDLLAEVEQP